MFNKAVQITQPPFTLLSRARTFRKCLDDPGFSNAVRVCVWERESARVCLSTSPDPDVRRSLSLCACIWCCSIILQSARMQLIFMPIMFYPTVSAVDPFDYWMLHLDKIHFQPVRMCDVVWDWQYYCQFIYSIYHVLTQHTQFCFGLSNCTLLRAALRIPTASVPRLPPRTAHSGAGRLDLGDRGG